ncbi:MAG: hypothetical protein FK730_07870 [Asgard group archaeon]|nr:hypothetical protein [Asgard group archaeon]
MNKEKEVQSYEQLNLFNFFLDLGTIDLKTTNWDHLLCLKSKKALDLVNKWAIEPIYTYRHEDDGLILVLSKIWKENELVCRIISLAKTLECEWIQNHYYGQL